MRDQISGHENAGPFSCPDIWSVSGHEKGPAFSCPDIWSFIFKSCIFRYFIFLVSRFQVLHFQSTQTSGWQVKTEYLRDVSLMINRYESSVTLLFFSNYSM